MPARTLILMVALPISTLCPTGCRRASIEEHRVMAAVREYTLNLPSVYAAQDLGLLSDCTTGDERERVGKVLEALKAKGLAMDARQEAARIEEVAVHRQGDLADLIAEETWWYRHHDARGKDVEPPRRIRYRLRYKLVLRQGEWLVDRHELLASEDLPLPAGGAP